MKKFPMHGTFRMEDSPTKSKKNVHGMLLTGKTSDGQDCIFAFSIVKSLEDSNNYTIKLDMYLPCGLWINLARIDADNISHQNFVDQNGQIVESFEALRELPTPHFHYFTEQAQVLQHDDLACMYAKGLDQYASDSLTQDQMFTQILTDFMGKCGIDTSIVSAKVQGCDYDHSNPLFVCDYSHETAQTTSFGDVVAYYELMQEEEKKQQAEKKQEVSQEEQQDMQK